MHVTSNYNNLSAEAKDKIAPLEPGEVAEYELLDIKPDPENKGKFKIPFMKGVPGESVIYDKGKPKKIAFIKGVRHKEVNDSLIEVPDIGRIYFYQDTAGKIILHGDNPRDVELHEYLQLCPNRQGSPFATANDTPIYRYIDHKKEAMQKAAARRKITDAMKFVGKMTDEDINRYAFLFSKKPVDDIELARAHVEQYAFDYPEKFLGLVQDETHFELQYAFKRALADNLIKIKPGNEVRWVSNDGLIAKLPANVTREELPRKFADWAGEHGENKDLATQVKDTVITKKPGPKKRGPKPKSDA